MPTPSRVSGFTFIELVAVVVILGVLAFAILPSVLTPNSGLLTSRDGIIAALSHAQQVAMARDGAGNPVTAVITANTIEVRENGVVVTSPGADYPLTLPNGITVTSGIGTLHYDKLGRTTATTIFLNSGDASVTVEASGYAH